MPTPSLEANAARAEAEGKIDLAENIRMALTREEWAVILVGLSNVPDNSAPRLKKMADRLTDHIQQHAAPVGVLVRVLRALRAE